MTDITVVLSEEEADVVRHSLLTAMKTFDTKSSEVDSATANEHSRAANLQYASVAMDIWHKLYALSNPRR